MSFVFRTTMVVLAALSPLVGWGQETLEGVVVDERGVAIEQAHCVVGQTLVLTDDEGRFRFEDEPERNGKLVKLAVTHVGFNSVEIQVMWPSSRLRVVWNLRARRCSQPLWLPPRPRILFRGGGPQTRGVGLDAVPATSQSSLRSVAGVHMVSAGQGMLRPVLRGLSGLR